MPKPTDPTRIDPKTFKAPAGATPVTPGLPAVGNAGLLSSTSSSSSGAKPQTSSTSVAGVPTSVNASFGLPPQTLSYFKVYSYNYYGAQATCQVGVDSDTPAATSGDTRTILFGGYHACGSAGQIDISGQATLMDEPADNELATAPSYYAPSGANAGYSSTAYYQRTSDTQFERILFRIQMNIAPETGGTWAGMSPGGVDGQQNCTGFGTPNLTCYIYSPSFPFIFGTGYDCSNTLDAQSGSTCAAAQSASDQAAQVTAQAASTAVGATDTARNAVSTQ